MGWLGLLVALEIGSHGKVIRPNSQHRAWEGLRGTAGADPAPVIDPPGSLKAGSRVLGP